MLKPTLTALAVLCAAPVSAQQANCGPRDDITVMLAERFHEARQTVALAYDASVIEQWANPETGTWTATRTTADGVTCIVAYGDNWEQIPQGEPA